MTWMTAVRDHPGRPSTMQRHVLLCLALRMDWRTGTGFASAAQLAADADASEDTAQRATTWARGHELLYRTRRGHRTGDGQVVASEWELTLPSQTRTGAGLSGPQTRSGRASNPQGPPSQTRTGAAPSRPSPSRPRSSAARARRRHHPPRLPRRHRRRDQPHHQRPEGPRRQIGARRPRLRTQGRRAAPAMRPRRARWS